jgi:hypothetical protein
MIKTLTLAVLMLASVSSFAQKKDSTDLTGTWRSMLDKGKPGFTFTKDGFLYFIDGSNKWGGPPAGDMIGKNYYKYKVGRIKGFFTLDIIVVKVVSKDKSEEVTKERGQGIFIYLKDGRIRIALSPPGDPRPTKLVSGETMVLTKQ